MLDNNGDHACIQLEINYTVVHVGHSLLQKFFLTECVLKEVMMLYFHQKIWLIVILVIVVVKEVHYHMLGIISNQRVQSLMHVTQTLHIFLDTRLLVELPVQAQELGKNTTLDNLAPSVTLMLSNRKFILTDQFKPVSKSFKILCSIKVVFMSTTVFLHKLVAMLLKLLDGDLVTGLLLTHGMLVGVSMVTFGLEWDKPTYGLTQWVMLVKQSYEDKEFNE